MPYQIIVFEELVKTYAAKITAIHWDKNKLTPYQVPSVEGVIYIPRSTFEDKEKMLSFAEELHPDLIYCAGWIDGFYNYVAKEMKKKGVVTVAGSDTQWRGGRQWANVLLSRFRQRKWFSYIWVAGSYQYEYAKKMGFGNNRIIFNSLTADVNLYRNAGKIRMTQKKRPHHFIYIGNFMHVKGTDLLIEAFEKFKKETNSDWKLICIGCGGMKNRLEGKPDVVVHNFKSQQEIGELSEQFGVFVLPSRSEQWGLVIHEAACLGLPMLLSDACGAKPTYLIDGYNGYSFKLGIVDDLTDKMKKISSLPEEELSRMAINSYALSARITPEISAASLISVIKRP